MGFERIVDGLDFLAYAGDEVRFSALFLETWRQVPPSTRRAIVTFWSDSRPSARMELMDTWSGWEVGVFGNVSLLGRQVRFHAPYVDRASDADVRYVVAHELAHVFQYARDEQRPQSALERGADAKAKQWLRVRRRPNRTPALRDHILAEYAELMRQARSQDGAPQSKPTTPNPNPEYVSAKNGYDLRPEQREARLWTEMDPWLDPEITDGHTELVAAFRRGGGNCGICGKPIDLTISTGPLRPTLDHIVSQSRGGGDDRANLQLAHQACNSRKGA